MATKPKLDLIEKLLQNGKDFSLTDESYNKKQVHGYQGTRVIQKRNLRWLIYVKNMDLRLSWFKAKRFKLKKYNNNNTIVENYKL